MGRKLTLLSLAAFAGCVEAAAAECTCRGRDVVAAEGETVCLATPAGARLARCDKLLNNTSWTFLPGACPTASRAGPGGIRIGMRNPAAETASAATASR